MESSITCRNRPSEEGLPFGLLHFGCTSLPVVSTDILF
nr:MAG TPA: hypothetical protein [Caudoviricetes sp.]